MTLPEMLEKIELECKLEKSPEWKQLKHRVNLVQEAVDDYDGWFRHNDISKILENSQRYKDALELLWLGEGK